MDKSQIEYINAINQSSDDEMLIKNTGWEVIDLPEHLHDTHQIIHTLSGTIHIRIGEDSYFVPERHIAWITRGTAHILSSKNRRISLQIINCRPLIGPAGKCSVFNTNRFIGENLRYITQKEGVVNRSDHPRLFDFTVGFLNLLPAMGEPYRTPLAALKVPDDTRVQQILGFINEHISQDIALEDIASNFGISVRTLSRILNKAHVRFAQYLNYQRITRAIELYADGDRSLQEIAYDVGYNSPNHFNRVFREFMGMNPTAFFSGG